MSQHVSLILLAFAVSLDGFSVGFTYGMRKIKIPFISIITIACCSALVLMISMGLGQSIASFLSPLIAEKIGGVVLVLIGAWVLYQFFRTTAQTTEVNEEKLLVKVEIKSLGLVINILKKPMVADFDKSGTITGLEAFMLGLALSLDAFGAGIGAALLGLSPWIMAVIVAIMSSLFLFIGMKSGTFFSKIKWVQKFSFLPGILLIVIGIWKF
ncbi:sporulation membrane protein YtaF [Ferdinandcohnia quinoae]|uniref:Sporulation membrane protein YtaF n=1 Tax=Fredinandcohnia quinoae TaxID=2918902 RepID=A0AAW5EC91_9BACI|nr:sporulation membrane protein YtaF [Fredinandcohnia sp. SECRCQ15]MCH1627295.1 sporulation membrane protein YtaF [Fredinandcohnia sp. SECRCQ15]